MAPETPSFMTASAQRDENGGGLHGLKGCRSSMARSALEFRCSLWAISKLEASGFGGFEAAFREGTKSLTRTETSTMR